MAEARPARVLVVDDNPANARLLQAQLERAGYRVASAASGRAGLEAVAVDPPDLVLLDAMMPGLDGYEVCRRLKAAEATRPIPVLMLTSLQERADKIRALEAGADDFLSRPVDRAELLARVASLVRLKQLYDELVEQRQETAWQARQLALEKSRAEAILYSLSDGVVTTDREERVTLLNPAAEAICGLSLEAALGRPWDEVLDLRDISGRPLRRERGPLREALQSGQPGRLSELALRRPDGQELLVSLAVAPIRQAGGEPIGAVVVLRDVTAERDLGRTKDQLVAVVSHELRTPLASLVGFTELLLTREVEASQRQLYLSTMLREGRRLTALINDFLDLQRLESGAQGLRLEPTDLRPVLEQALAAVGDDPAHPLVASLEEPLPPVLADAERVAQVLANLLDNARKYSPGGGEIRVAARVVGGEVEIEVADQGLGLPAEALPRLFSKFYRVDNTNRRAIKGTGLGLAIVKHLVEAHGGRVWARSDGLGKGSTFGFSLPVAGAPVPRRAGEAPATRVPAVQPGGGVLVVEDDPGYAQWLSGALRDEGYRVEVAVSAEQALEAIGRERPAVVLLDLRLQGQLDGWDLLAVLRGRPETQDLPVVVVSAYDEPSRGQALGVDDYLLKPVAKERLVSVLRRLAVDRERLVLVVEDDLPTRALALRVLESSGARARGVGSGSEALAALEAEPEAYGLLVLDLGLPDMDGFALLDAVRGRLGLSELPVVVFTARELSEPEKRYFAGRAVEIVRKGNGVPLLEAVARALGRSPAATERD